MTINAVIITAPNSDVISFNLDAFKNHFGDRNGQILFTEFNFILQKEKSIRAMEVFVAIWRVLGKEWTTKIASVAQARKTKPSQGQCSVVFFIFVVGCRY